MRILIIDFEASAPGRPGYPVEVAWADPRGRSGTASLIRPDPAWEVEGSWDPAAEAVHGIPRALLDSLGRPAAAVGDALLLASEGAALVSDMPPFDARMLRMLLGDRAPPLLDFWEEVRRRGRRELENRAVAEVERLLPARHRAADDVRKLRFLWRAIVGNRR